MSREKIGQMPDGNGENKEVQEIEAIETTAVPTNPDDYATGDEAEYDANQPAPSVPSRFVAKMEASRVVGKSDSKNLRLGVNAREGGMGMGKRGVKLSTTHTVREKAAGAYGRVEDGESEDNNKSAIEAVLGEFVGVFTFRLEVSNEDRQKYFLQVFDSNNAGKNRKIFGQTDTLERLAQKLREHLNHNYQKQKRA